MRADALRSLTRTEADMSDAELFDQQAEQYWYINMCLTTLHRLPSEIDQLLLCREYTELQAYAIVQRTIAQAKRDRSE